MKTILTFLAGIIVGAMLMYMYLWYDAYRTFEGALCNISTKSECE